MSVRYHELIKEEWIVEDILGDYEINKYNKTFFGCGINICRGTLIKEVGMEGEKVLIFSLIDRGPKDLFLGEVIGNDITDMSTDIFECVCTYIADTLDDLENEILYEIYQGDYGNELNEKTTLVELNTKFLEIKEEIINNFHTKYSRIYDRILDLSH